jgi:hypothetical protein
MSGKLAAIVSIMLAVALLTSAPLERPASATQTSGLNATEEVLESVSRLRGLAVKQTIKRGLKTRDEIEREVLRDLDESNSPEEMAAASKTFAKLGLIPKEFALRDYYVRLLREQVAGFYQPKTQEFYLAAWIPVSEQRIVIAHELVHALQDQHFNLRRFEKWPRGDSDAEIAAHALVEGDATIVMYKYALAEQGLQSNQVAMNRLIEMLKNDSEPVDATKYPALAQAPAVLRESLQFPYSYGAAFVNAILSARSLDGLNGVYDRLPASTEQVIHPDRYLLFDDPVKFDLSDLSVVLGQGWKRIDVDISGEFGFQIILGEFLSKSRARVAAAGWDGDRYALYESSQGQLLLTVRTTWDTERDAREFFEAYAERTAKRYKISPSAESSVTSKVFETAEGLAEVEIRGMDVVIVEGSDSRQRLRQLMERIWQTRKS